LSAQVTAIDVLEALAAVTLVGAASFVQACAGPAGDDVPAELTARTW
jgi:hypothetical protein